MTPRFASLTEILPLRAAVIIAGTARDSPFFPGDDAPSTRHMGVFEGDRCVACATWMQSTWAGEPAMQLRGMATAPDYRGQGLGRLVLAFAEETLRPLAQVFWCNARVSAAPFYEHMGWRRTSECFQIDGVGPHFRMVRQLDQPPV